MQFCQALSTLFIISSLIAASPLDRSFLAERQADQNVIWVTVTSAYIVTLTNTLPQSTETVTVNASFGTVAQPSATTTTSTGDNVAPAPVIPTPVTTTQEVDPPVAGPVTSTSSLDPPPPPTASPTPVAPPSENTGNGPVFSGQGTFFSPAYVRFD